MSRFGNPHRPTGLDAPDLVHQWAVVDPTSPALLLFAVLETQLEATAQALGLVVASAPSYETYRIRDEHVPPHVLRDLDPAALDGRPLAVVHAYALVAARNTPRRAAAALPLHTH